MASSYGISFLIFGCLLLSYASDPSPCCTPKQWQATVTQDGCSISQRKGIKVSLLTGKLVMYYDSIHKRVRIDEVNSLNPVHIKVIHDLSKNVSYTVYGNNCTSSILTGKFIDFCIPKNSTYNGNRTIGDSLLVDAWALHYQDSSKFARTDVTKDKCIPTTEVFFQSSLTTSSSVYATNIYSNVENKFNSSEVFKKPAECQDVTRASNVLKMDVDLRKIIWDLTVNHVSDSNRHFMTLDSSQLQKEPVKDYPNYSLSHHDMLNEKEEMKEFVIPNKNKLERFHDSL